MRVYSVFLAVIFRNVLLDLAEEAQMLKAVYCLFQETVKIQTFKIVSTGYFQKTAEVHCTSVISLVETHSFFNSIFPIMHAAISAECFSSALY
jgi:hypothetical protein